MATGHGDVLGSRELIRERDELREICEALEYKNSDAGKELVEI